MLEITLNQSGDKIPHGGQTQDQVPQREYHTCMHLTETCL